MRYKGIKPQKVGFCYGCVFNEGHCSRSYLIDGECVIGGDHKYIFIKIDLKLNKSVKVI